jgi:hypothetical protein
VISSDFEWPDGLDPDTVCFSIDVEWAAEAVVADVCSLLDEHGVRATFFVTHDGVSVPGHERGLHPNFRRGGDTYRAMPNGGGASEPDIYEHIVSTTLGFAPEAKGVRAHSLFYDSILLPVYHHLGIEYDSSYHLPFVANLRPFWKHDDIVEIPLFYGDHLDLTCGTTGFEVARLGLEQPGLKVFNFHPNIIYLNCPDGTAYAATRSFYHDSDRLLAARHHGRGTRTLLTELLEHVRVRNVPTATLGQVNELVRGRGVPARNRRDQDALPRAKPLA